MLEVAYFEAGPSDSEIALLNAPAIRCAILAG